MFNMMADNKNNRQQIYLKARFQCDPENLKSSRQYFFFFFYLCTKTYCVGTEWLELPKKNDSNEYSQDMF